MWENRNIKLATTERRRNYSVSERNYQTTKFFMEDLVVIEMRKTKILMNKPVYLPILGLIKAVMYDFWYGCIKPKYGENVKLCYKDTDSFIVHLKQVRWYLQRHSRCWNKIWHFKFWVRYNIA